MSKTLTVVLGEYDIGWHDPKHSLEGAEQLVQRGAAAGARLVVLPEMATTGFTMDAAQSVPIDSPDVVRLREMAKKNGVWVVVGVALDEGGDRPVNAALAIDPSGKIVALHRKRRLFAYAQEHDHYKQGDESTVIEVDGVKIGLFICYELRFSELFARVADEVSAMIVIASWPAARRSHWDVLLQARSIENQCAVIGVNRIGTGGNVVYDGGSVAYNAWGERIQPSHEAGVPIVTLDIDAIAQVRSKYPFLADREVSERQPA